MCSGLVGRAGVTALVTPPALVTPQHHGSPPDLLLFLLKEYGEGGDLGGRWNFSILECPAGKIYTKPKRSWGYGRA